MFVKTCSWPFSKKEMEASVVAVKIIRNLKEKNKKVYGLYKVGAPQEHATRNGLTVLK